MLILGCVCARVCACVRACVCYMCVRVLHKNITDVDKHLLMRVNINGIAWVAVSASANERYIRRRCVWTHAIVIDTYRH